MPITRWESDGGLVRNAKASTPPRPDSPYHTRNWRRPMPTARTRNARA